MDQRSLNDWFENLKNVLEEAYLQHNEPRKQSGFLGPEEAWIQCRKPIADCLDKSGTFLDIGCANGYLLECVAKWSKERGIEIIPYGLDLSERLIGLARERLPKYESHFFVGNGWTWNPPMKFDYVRTEVVYVPEELQEKYVKRLLNEFINVNGKLLVAEYRSRKDTESRKWIDEYLKEWDLTVEFINSGYYEGKELTRFAVIEKDE